MKPEWIKFDGSDDQIYGILGSKFGFITEDNVRIECTSDCVIMDILAIGDKYLLYQPHPLADMICQQARTGQPVWVKVTKIGLDADRYQFIESCIGYSIYVTNYPDWHIPGAEYSFTSFEEEEEVADIPEGNDYT